MTKISYILYTACGICMLLAMVNLILTIVRVIKYEIEGEDIDIDATPMLRTARLTGLSVLTILIEASYESSERMTTSGMIVVVTTIVITVAIVGLLEYHGYQDRCDVREGGEGFFIQKLL